MALQGPIPVESGQVFPRGAFAAGGFEPVRDYDASQNGRFVQARDKGTGLPVWVVDVIDADPAARDKSVKVKLPAADQPVLPTAAAGAVLPFVPLEFTGLAVTPYVSQAGRLAYSIKASGVRVAGADRARKRRAGGSGMSTSGGSFGTASMHAGTDWAVRCSTYPDQLPILSIDAGNFGVTITVAGRSEPGPGGAAFARELAAQAARFAAECERIHAASSGSAPDSTARDQAAGNAAA